VGDGLFHGVEWTECRGQRMFGAVAEFVSTQQGDSAEFIEKARALAIGVARDYELKRLYVVRIDSWFGPKWMHFAGKFSVGKGAGFGVHKTRLHVPPFVPQRAVTQRVFVGPGFEKTVAAAPLHIECASKEALKRRIEDIDKDAAFVWFSGESEEQKRGAVMVYLPVAPDPTLRWKGSLRGCGAFYVGFSLPEMSWGPTMLRGISRGEVAHLEESGRAALDNPPFTVKL
jgi:hypothetical protein